MDTTEQIKLRNKLDTAISEAVTLISKEMLPEESMYAIESDILIKLKSFALEPDEQVIFMVRESRFHDLLTPEIIMVTNRKIVMTKPSLWHFLGIKSLSLRFTDYVQYAKINEISQKRGLLLRSIRIAIAGAQDEVVIEGLRRSEAEIFIRFVEKVLEGLGD